MYYKHSKLKMDYPDSQKIWRYQSLSKFQNIIDKKSLFFCRADKFCDKWEGVLPNKSIDTFNLNTKFIKTDDGIVSLAQWHNKKELRSHLINCWHVNDNESYAMWKIYSGYTDSSVLIQSTIGRLKEALKISSERIWIGQVEYIDFNDWSPQNKRYNSSFPNTLQTFLLKWNYFKFENEIRAIINKAYSNHCQEIGINVSVNITELIESVFVSPISTESYKNLIEDYLHKNQLIVPIYKSGINVLQ